MTAGLFLTVRIWRFSTSPNDDVVGGAQPSGTILYPNLSARIEAVEPTQALLEQGLEIPLTYHAVIGGTKSIRANDQLEVIGPPLSPYYNDRFRVIGVLHASMIDPRGFSVLVLRRIETAMSNIYQ